MAKLARKRANKTVAANEPFYGGRGARLTGAWPSWLGRLSAAHNQQDNQDEKYDDQPA